MEAAVETAVKAGGPLADKILAAVDEGKDITVVLIVTTTGATTASKTVDIEIIVKADGTRLGNISEVESPITFAVSLEGLTGRIIRVLREHNGGTPAVIPSTVSGNMVTFSSDLFSTFTIEASNDIGQAAVEAIPDKAYTGAAITPSVTVTINGGEKLTEGVDYTLSYENNVEPGTASVIITGMGAFAGYTRTVTFTITAPTATPTPTPTATPTPTPTATAEPTATPEPTTEPTATAVPTATAAPTASAAPRSPQTGDETPLALYAALLALCLSGLAVTLTRRKKGNK